MKLAFVNPPTVQGQVIEAEDCCWGMNSQHILPAMLLACASEAKRAGHEVAYVDLAIDPRHRLTAFEPDAVIYPLAYPLHYAQVYQAMQQAVTGHVPHIILSVPPGYARIFSNMSPAPFAAIYSEPELVTAILPLDARDLVQWRAISPGITHNGYVAKKLPTCLHRLDPVDFSLVPERYWIHYVIAVYQVTRGCPYRCRFCVWGGSTVTDRTFRMRPAVQVAGDMLNLKMTATRAGAKPPILYLLAAQLTTSQTWVDEFAQTLDGAPYPFESNVSLADVTEDKLGKLMQAGMRVCACGLEAMTDRTLALLNKPYNWAEALESLTILEASGIAYKAHLCIGYGETAADVREAITNLRAMHSAGIRRVKINFNQVSYYDGTDIAEDVPYPTVMSPQGVPVQARPPAAEWAEFIRLTAKLGYLSRKGVRGCTPGFVEAMKQ